MFGIFGDTDGTAAAGSTNSGNDAGSFQSTASSLFKQIEQTTDLPEDLKSGENISEEE